MKKQNNLMYAGVAAAVIVGGYFAYKKFVKTENTLPLIDLPPQGKTNSNDNGEPTYNRPPKKDCPAGYISTFNTRDWVWECSTIRKDVVINSNNNGSGSSMEGFREVSI